MDIKITALHFKADSKLEQFISDKINKLEKLHDGIIGAEVLLKLDNNETNENKIVEIKLKIRGNDAMAIKISTSFEESTALAIDALKKQLIKTKEKMRS